jgi:divalent metal cation (Fe/Co/Zn/Cd) transporter
MRLAHPIDLPDEKRALWQRSRRLAWTTIGLLSTATVFLVLTVGQSQAMKTAWITDVLSILPPAALLLATRVELAAPTRRFPYGYSRAIAISFLVTASVLTLFGVYLFADAGLKLVRQERPPIGTMVIFGHQLWAGWLMIAALTYSLTCAMIVGQIKEPIARELHDKALFTDAVMNRDEWMSEGAAIVGLLLVAIGFWWGDAASAALISINVIRDGWYNTREVVADLMDEAPSVLGTHEGDELPLRLKHAAEALPWVQSAAVRLREHGRMVTGEVFVVPADDSDLVGRIERAAQDLERVDWRVRGLTLMPVRQLGELEVFNRV